MPQVLPCGHVVCLECVLALQPCTCPKCRQPFPDPSPSGESLDTMLPLTPDDLSSGFISDLEIPWSSLRRGRVISIRSGQGRVVSSGVTVVWG